MPPDASGEVTTTAADIDETPDDADSRSWRGVVAIEHPEEILFGKRIDISPGKLRSWTPDPINARSRRSDDDALEMPDSKWRKVVLALESLGGLRDNWDGFGAAAPSGAMIGVAIGLAEYLDRQHRPAPTSVAPTPAGTILFAWDDAEYIEIEIRSDCCAEWMRIGEGGSVEHGEGSPLLT